MLEVDVDDLDKPEMARVRAHQYYYRDASPKESYTQATDRRVNCEAAVPALQWMWQSHCCETRLHVEIKVYTQG